MTYQVIICTHQRWNTISTATLRWLADTGVEASRIHLIVTPGQETEYQHAVDPALYGHLHTGAQGLAANRNAATALFPQDTRLVQADDDLKGLYRLTDTGTALEPVPDTHTFITEAFTVTRAHGATMWGVYPVPNHYFMRPRTTLGLKFLIGQLQGYTNRRNERLTISEKDDYERTLLRWQKDGQVLRYDSHTVKAAPIRKNPGGLQDTNRAEASRNSAAYLQHRWPNNVRLGKTRDGYQEIRLVT